MTVVAQDIRYALRLLTRNPGFAAVAIVTLALGIGATTAMFAVVHAVLLKPLPYVDPDRLVILKAPDGDGTMRPLLATSEVRDLRETAGLFERIGAVILVAGSLTSAEGSAGMERIAAVNSSDDFLPALGVRPVLGRLLDERIDVGSQGVRAVLISSELWRRRYNSDPAIIGRTIEVNNIQVAIVGVLPTGFQLYAGQDTRLPARPDVWFSAGMDPARQDRSATAIARLAPAVAIEDARARLAVVAAQLTAKYPDVYRGAPLRFDVERLQDHSVRAAKPALVALIAAVACVLLVACANIANLLLTRSSLRSRELAIRTAVGADRSRLLQQLLTEGLVLGLTGGAAGILLALWTETFLAWLRPASLPPVTITAGSAAVLIFAFVTSVVTSLLFSLLPAFRTIRMSVADVLKAGGRSGAPGTRRLRSSLIVIEVGLSVMLLIGAGLMIRTIVALRQIDPGFDATHVLTMGTEMRPREFSDFARKWQFYRQVIDGVRGLPGVQSASAVSPLPLEGTTRLERFADADAGASTDRELVAASSTVLHGYFATMSIPVIEGRELQAADIDAQRDVAIVDENFARTMWPGRSAIGKQIRLRRGAREGAPTAIIGVVGHVRSAGLRAIGEPQVYLPYHQNAVYNFTVVLRSSGDEQRLATPARVAIESLGGKRPVHHIRPMTAYLDDATTDTRFLLVLLSIFAAMALALAAVGLYGVIAHAMVQRIREIGIRQALGATSTAILSLVMRDGLRWTAAGLALGLIGSVAATRLLDTLLFGVSRLDATTIAGVVALLAAASAAACYVPARRATRITATEALRAE
jgi:putative ABC transport system permease protein